MTESSGSDLPLISIIMAAYNTESYIKEAIKSVLNQSYSNFELLIIDDGSIDSTKARIFKFIDPRIRYFSQKNKGASAARNVGLTEMRGAFFCFLDADDVLPPKSLSDRVVLFGDDAEVHFVDGRVLKFNNEMTSLIEEWKPNFYRKNPLIDLIHLTGASFFGTTWMIRRDRNQVYKFREGLSHAEDLLFFMELARSGGYYKFTSTEVLHYRDTPNSAMKNLEGLERGYRYIEHEIQNWSELSSMDLAVFKLRWRKFMMLDYFRQGRINEMFRLMT